MGNSSEELIKQMFDAQLKAQKEQLQNDHNAAVSDLDAQKQMNQKVTDTNLNRTAVEAQKGAVSDEEYYAAAGLTSGAKAQARMARENQLLSNLTAIRAAQQTADAESERQRGLLAREFDSAIRKAQAENDLQKAQALYEEAEKRDAALLKQQEAAANLMAQGGDYSRYGALYGLTDAEVNRLNALYAAQATVTEGDDGGEDEEESPGGEVPNDPGNGLLQGALLGALGQQPTEPTEPTLQDSPGFGGVLGEDMQSILDLGYGPISPARLEELIAAGEVEEYVENGMYKYRKVKKRPTSINNGSVRGRLIAK